MNWGALGGCLGASVLITVVLYIVYGLYRFFKDLDEPRRENISLPIVSGVLCFIGMFFNNLLWVFGIGIVLLPAMVFIYYSKK